MTAVDEIVVLSKYELFGNHLVQDLEIQVAARWRDKAVEPIFLRTTDLAMIRDSEVKDYWIRELCNTPVVNRQWSSLYGFRARNYTHNVPGTPERQHVISIRPTEFRRNDGRRYDDNSFMFFITVASEILIESGFEGESKVFREYKIRSLLLSLEALYHLLKHLDDL